MSIETLGCAEDQTGCDSQAWMVLVLLKWRRFRGCIETGRVQGKDS